MKIGNEVVSDMTLGDDPAKRMPVIAMDPASSPRNSFVDHFRVALEDAGGRVVPFEWTWASLFRYDYILLHWPRMFFDAGEPKRRALKSLVKLLLFKTLRRGKILWVVHNLDHHEGAPSTFARPFIRIVDGFIFLSKVSVRLFTERYAFPASSVAVTTVHGRYIGSNAPRAIKAGRDGKLGLLHFGVIRPYKNIEGLLHQMIDWAPDDCMLTIAGLKVDADLAGRIEQSACRMPQTISVDLRDTPIEDAELEDMIDRHDAVILPYEKILNSGAAFLALSRHRPVIAPAIGAMPELRAAVGADWIYLYDGALTPETLRAARDWIGDTPRTAPDLSAYDWRRVTRDLASFINLLQGGGGAAWRGSPADAEAAGPRVIAGEKQPCST